MLSEQEIDKIVREARVIAVVGMQDERKDHRAAYQIPRMLLGLGYELIPINPKIQVSMGIPALSDVASLTTSPDILDVFRREEAIPGLTDEILALPPDKRPKTVWLQSGIMHEVSERRLEDAGIRVVSDRCLGVAASRLRRGG